MKNTRLKIIVAMCAILATIILCTPAYSAVTQPSETDTIDSILAVWWAKDVVTQPFTDYCLFYTKTPAKSVACIKVNKSLNEKAIEAIRKNSTVVEGISLMLENSTNCESFANQGYIYATNKYLAPVPNLAEWLKKSTTLGSTVGFVAKTFWDSICLGLYCAPGEIGQVLYSTIPVGTKNITFNIEKTINVKTEAECVKVAEVVAAQFEKDKLIPKTTFFGPILEIFIPGVKLVDIKPPTDGSSLYYLPWIGQYVSAIYKFAIAIASILAVILIIVQGIKIVVSGGGEGKVQAYKNIGRIIIGLVIAWGSYSILYIINPNLLTLKNIEVEYIESAPVDQMIADNGTDNSEDDTSAATTEGCIDKSDPTKFVNITTYKGGLKFIDVVSSYPYLTIAAADALKKVDDYMAIYTKPENKPLFQRLILTSAGRTVATQSDLWKKALAKYGTPEKARSKASPPSCRSPHMSGSAIDIKPDNGPAISWDSACKTNAAIASMWGVLQGNGWTRYCNEWWHFEINSGITASRTTATTQCAKCSGK